MKDIIVQAMHAPEAFSVKAMLVKGWETTQKYWRQAVLLLLGDLVLIGLMLAITVGLVFVAPILGLVAYLLLILSQLAFYAILTRFTVWAANDKGIILKELVQIKGQTVLSFVTFGILYTLVVVAGFLLLILPGIYFATVYCLGGFLVVDKNMGPIEAMKASKQIVGTQLFEIFAYYAIVNSFASLLILPLYYLVFLTAAFQDPAPALSILVGILAAVVGVVTLVAVAAYMFVYTFGFAHIYKKLAHRG